MDQESSSDIKTWLGCSGSWHLPETAKALQTRSALGGLWISDRNRSQISPELYHRCWPYHLGMKFFYHGTSQIIREHAFYALFPLWKRWLLAQEFPPCNVVQAIMGYATEPFDWAERNGALKVVDCPNSHPTSYYGYWQRECDLWCPGEKVPIPRWIFARMNRELERADMILCPSNFVRDTMITNGIPASKCFVNPFGVNTSVFKPRPKPPENPRFLAVGTICIRKGFQYLLRAFEMVKKSLPNAELICVGEFKTDFRLEKKRWEGTFTHVQHMNHQQLAELMASSTAFVFPSCEEGFARVLSEAMGTGLPIIASYESGASTMVEDGVEGYLTRGRDPGHISEAMIKVATDRELNRRMGEASLLKGAARNTWQDYGDRLIAEYRRRIAGR